MTESKQPTDWSGKGMNSIEGKYLTFSLAQEEYGIGILKVKEIIGMMPITVVPRTPGFIKGVINLRGKVIPVIDLRKRFDFPVASHDKNTRLLIITVGKQLLGLEVDEVTEVISLHVKDIKPPPQVVNGVGAEFLVGVCLAKDSLIMLLNLDKILTDRESSELSTMAVEST